MIERSFVREMEKFSREEKWIHFSSLPTAYTVRTHRYTRRLSILRTLIAFQRFLLVWVCCCVYIVLGNFRLLRWRDATLAVNLNLFKDISELFMFMYCFSSGGKLLSRMSGLDLRWGWILGRDMLFVLFYNYVYSVLGVLKMASFSFRIEELCCVW